MIAIVTALARMPFSTSPFFIRARIENWILCLVSCTAKLQAIRPGQVDDLAHNEIERFDDVLLFIG